MPHPMYPTAKEGLWAWYRGKFYGFYWGRETEKKDHVTWFGEVGLPQFGPEFDHILRGRMEFDRRRQAMVISWYGIPYLPNTVYESVVHFFKARHCNVIEKFNASTWA